MSGVISVDHVAAPTTMSDGNLHAPFTEIDQALIDRLIERYVDASEQAPEKVDAGQVSAFGSALCHGTGRRVSRHRNLSLRPA